MRVGKQMEHGVFQPRSRRQKESIQIQQAESRKHFQSHGEKSNTQHAH